jgi:hypothetical protein
VWTVGRYSTVGYAGESEVRLARECEVRHAGESRSGTVEARYAGGSGPGTVVSAGSADVGAVVRAVGCSGESGWGASVPISGVAGVDAAGDCCAGGCRWGGSVPISGVAGVGAEASCYDRFASALFPAAALAAAAAVAAAAVAAAPGVALASSAAAAASRAFFADLLGSPAAAGEAAMSFLT